jgi:hypothetical protein
MDALLEELCTKYGWCLKPEDRDALVAAGLQDREEIADSIIRAEFGEAGVQNKSTRAFLMPIVDDWLFDSAGRGARSPASALRQTVSTPRHRKHWSGRPRAGSCVGRQIGPNTPKSPSTNSTVPSTTATRWGIAT